MIGLALVLLLQLPPPPAPAPAMGEAVADTIVAATPARPLPPARPRPVPDELADLRDDPAFQYDRPEAEAPSFWDRFWAWIARTFFRPIRQGVESKPTQWALMALAVCAFLYVLLRVLRGEGSGLFGRRDLARSDASDPLLDVDDIEAVDLGSRLAEALRSADHRAAVRLRYLLALQRLAERDHIEWARDKTNRTYVVEARQSGGAELGRAFADVTRVFDHVWYGGLAVDAARYGRFAARFDRLDGLLARSPARVATPAPA